MGYTRQELIKFLHDITSSVDVSKYGQTITEEEKKRIYEQKRGVRQ